MISLYTDIIIIYNSPETAKSGGTLLRNEPLVHKEVFLMNKYEVLYIIRNDAEDEQKSALADKFSELVKGLNAENVIVDKWGTKKFAYPIDFKNEGYYVLMTFDAAPDVPEELRRQLMISDDVVRQMIVKK